MAKSCPGATAGKLKPLETWMKPFFVEDDYG